jgi:hypothetical protein
MRQFVAQLRHALLNEVGQQQRQRDTKHNHLSDNDGAP